MNRSSASSGTSRPARAADANWFTVDRKGLANLVQRRGAHWILAELLQNAWDAPGTSKVDVTLKHTGKRNRAEIVVLDDSPAGFVDLGHAFTLFAPSQKAADPNLRGRYNLGEKLVLALAESATIESTTGTVEFRDDGRIVHPRRKRAAGSEFRAVLRVSKNEVAEMLLAAESFLVPEGITTTLNGERLKPRAIASITDASLMTELADEDGVLRRRRRKTMLKILKPIAGESARLYELGIPICTLPDDRYHVNVCQKVPLNLERDGVSHGYLREVRAAVLNETADTLDADSAAAGWVADAIASDRASGEAVTTAIGARFGKAVVYDPSDIEANHRAVAAGYQVVHGGSFSAEQWTRIRDAGALVPAGQVTPTPRPFSPEGKPAEVVEATPAMAAFRVWAERIGKTLLGKAVTVTFLRDFNAVACYADGSLDFNVRRLGKRFFDGPAKQEQISLLLHELAHDRASNHLSRAYYDALSDLGAGLALAAASNPSLITMEKDT